MQWRLERLARSLRWSLNSSLSGSIPGWAVATPIVNVLSPRLSPFGEGLLPSLWCRLSTKFLYIMISAIIILWLPRRHFPHRWNRGHSGFWAHRFPSRCHLRHRGYLPYGRATLLLYYIYVFFLNIKCLIFSFYKENYCLLIKDFLYGK